MSGSGLVIGVDVGGTFTDVFLLDPAARSFRTCKVASHRGDDIRRAIKAAGATLRFLPPYSPDFNPIELCFAKLKAILRGPATVVRRCCCSSRQGK